MKSFSSHITLTCLLIYTSVFISRFSSCTVSNSASNQNLSHIYKTGQNYLHPQYTVFHRTNTSSELHFKINSKELLYSKQSGGETFNARISLQYKLISSYENVGIIDSATVLITDPYSPAAKDIIGKIEFSATFTNGYLLEINMTDVNRNITSKHFINVEKQDHAGRQNFLLLSSDKKIPLFRNQVAGDEKFHLRYRSMPQTLVYVRYYRRSFPMPSAPFSESNMVPFEYRADSLFTLDLNEKDTAGFTFPKAGFYHIQADTSTKDGFTLFRFEEDFPQVKKPDQMLPPLYYLTSRQEFEVLNSYANKKIPVDSFWVYAGGSHDRARELVRKFYGRVQDVNNYFSSYVEGWKTDRGMIYLVYGPPNIVYKSSGSENWVYGEENNFNSLTFTFIKVINPFTDNDYRLERSQVFQTGWYNSREMWRQGRIYSEK